MLGRTGYTSEEIDAARDRVERQLTTYRGLAGPARVADPAAAAAFERELYVNLVLVLDQLFVHRLRKLEAKEPALRRVREIAAAAATDTSVTLTEDEFTDLAADFLSAIARVYPATD
jgi:hypothetical protein